MIGPLCDHCGEVAPARLHLQVHVRDHVAAESEESVIVMLSGSVNSIQHFLFCSDDCRNAWWQEPGEVSVSHLHGLEDGKHQHIRVTCVHADPGRHPVVTEDVALRTAIDLDAYWIHSDVRVEEIK